MAEWHDGFLPTTIGHLLREARYGDSIRRNGMLIWQNFGLPPSTIRHPPSAINNTDDMSGLEVLCLFK